MEENKEKTNDSQEENSQPSQPSQPSGGMSESQVRALIGDVVTQYMSRFMKAPSEAPKQEEPKKEDEYKGF